MSLEAGNAYGEVGHSGGQTLAWVARVPMRT